MAGAKAVSMPAQRAGLKQFLTEAELSEMIAVPRSTLRWWRFICVGPTYVKFEGSVRYSIKAVQEYVDSNTQVPALAALEDRHAA